MFNAPTLRLNYPHMLKSDSEIWHRFLQKYPDYFDMVDYDIHIGQGVTPDPSWDANIASMATALTQRRIDVLGVKGLLWYIVEVKKDPGVSALGQLIGYRVLYKLQYSTRPTPRLLLIANRVDDDLASILSSQNISSFVV